MPTVDYLKRYSNIKQINSAVIYKNFNIKNNALKITECGICKAKLFVLTL